MKTYEDSAMFSEDDYEGFSFVQDVTCNMNDNAEDTRQLDPSAQSVNHRHVYEQAEEYYAKKALLLHCNAGVTTVNKIGDLPVLAQYGSMKMVLLTYYHSTM